MKHKLIFVGNSIVAGYPWSKGKSFVSVLRKTLTGENRPGFAKSIGFDIINKGVNGDTTSGIMDRFKTDALDHKPNIVFFMTGTNDFIYRDATPSEAFANLELMATLAEKAGAMPIYMTPIPVDANKAEFMWLAGCGISYDAVNRELDTFSDMLRKSGRHFVDTNALFREYSELIGDPDLVYLDGLHPMPAGHVFIADELIKYLEVNVAELSLK